MVGACFRNYPKKRLARFIFSHWQMEAANSINNENHMNNEQPLWEECKLDKDYEICLRYPHEIRRKGSKKVLVVGTNPNGYQHVTLNGKQLRVHRIIAIQWIPNDDPANKTVIDHINRNRADNRIENLRWSSISENNHNREQPAVYNRITKKELHAFVWWLIGKWDTEGHDKWDNYSHYRIQKLYQDETGKFLHAATIKRNRTGWYRGAGNELVRVY